MSNASAAHPPLILSTWSFGARGNAVAWPTLNESGSALDAVETVCRIVEADSEVDSVGYGGLPDRTGRMTLDGCIMLSPSKAGSVCSVRGCLHVVSLARRVMERTPHAMLAGEGAEQFAAEQGFETRDLLAPEAEAKWKRWLERPATIDQSRDRGYVPTRPVDTGQGGVLFHETKDGAASPSDGPAGVVDPDEARWAGHDTVGALAMDRSGVIAGACSTSGTPYKMPGRVGDSPIIGHGLYVDPLVGGATATGGGELIMGTCTSFLAVELMRAGRSPRDAVEIAIARVRDSFTLKSQHQVAVIALRADGAWAAGALRPGYKTSVQDGAGQRIVDPDVVLLPDEPTPEGGEETGALAR